MFTPDCWLASRTLNDFATLLISITFIGIRALEYPWAIPCFRVEGWKDPRAA